VELQAAKNREKRALSDEARDLMDRLRRAREDLRAAQGRLRAKKTEPQAVREAEHLVERVAGEVAIGGPLEPLLTTVEDGDRAPVRALDLRKGMRVWVTRLRAEADVVDLLGGSVRVAAGPLKLTVPLEDLRVGSPPAASPRASSPIRAVPARPESLDETPLQTRDNTCDLRGLRVDDGVAMATSFLDRALSEGLAVVFLLHGHGSGALRDAIRGELARSRYVARFRGGAPHQGGDGVTLVWLA
jgi:DNA mismatch repair protein MutS2